MEGQGKATHRLRDKCSRGLIETNLGAESRRGLGEAFARTNRGSRTNFHSPPRGTSFVGEKARPPASSRLGGNQEGRFSGADGRCPRGPRSGAYLQLAPGRLLAPRKLSWPGGMCTRTLGLLERSREKQQHNGGEKRDRVQEGKGGGRLQEAHRRNTGKKSAA